MNLRTLKYLVALAELQHFGKAAAASFVSQPTLSMQIKKLEDELGVQLLERTNKSVHLTAIGKTLAEQARHIVQLTNDMKKTAQLAKDPYQGEIKIGLIPTIAPYLLPHIIQKLSKKFPRLTLLLSEAKTAELFVQLKQGSIDVVIGAIENTKSEFIETALFSEEFLLAVPPSDPLAKLKSIKIEQLHHQKILLLEEGHCLRAQALEVCRHIETVSQQNFQSTSLETLRHMVASGAGITLLPKLAQQKNDGIVYIPFAKPKPMRTIGMFWRKASAQEALFMELVETIKTSIKPSL